MNSFPLRLRAFSKSVIPLQKRVNVLSSDPPFSIAVTLVNRKNFVQWQQIVIKLGITSSIRGEKPTLNNNISNSNSTTNSATKQKQQQQQQ